MAGQGTLGMELARQAPDLDAVFVCVGGGGLVGGVGAAIQTLSPRTRIVGVWPEASPCMRDSIRAGAIVRPDESLVGNECVRTVRNRETQFHSKKKKHNK